MDSGIALLIVLVLALLLVGPVLAIAAFVRVSRLASLGEQLSRLTARIHDLEQRLAALDRRLGSPSATAETPTAQPVPTTPSVVALAEDAQLEAPAAPPQTPLVPPSPVAPPVVSPPAHAVSPLSRPQPSWTRLAASAAVKPKADTNVEEMIAGRWLYYVGILALLFAVAFFLEYAFDNNWIGPRGRVGIGILLGAAMFPLSDWLLHRSYRYFSEGITGLGSAILYLSIWAGWHYYMLFPQSAAFAVMIVITGLTAAVAIGRNSERIAVLAVVGGMITPLLVSTGQNQEVTLFAYLTILGVGMLGISFWRNWKWIAPLEFIGTLIFFWGWYADFYSRYELETTLVFATVFFVLFAVLPAIRSSRDGEFEGAEIAVMIANAFNYLLALRLMLWPEFRWGLTIAVLLLAAAHLLAERATPVQNKHASRLVHTAYAGLALMFATLAIPIRLDGKWITIAWAVEGALLVWSGLRIRSMTLRAAGIVLFGIVAVRLGAVPFHPGQTFLLNERFLTMAVCAACWLSAFIFARRSQTELSPSSTQMFYVIAIAANLLFLTALSLEVWDLYGRLPSLGIDRSLAQNLALSVLWLVYALVLLAGGVIKKSAALRWQALALLGVVVVKVFFFDLSFLERFYRIISFFLLGLVLMLVSFFYQRGVSARRGEKRS